MSTLKHIWITALLLIILLLLVVSLKLAPGLQASLRHNQLGTPATPVENPPKKEYFEMFSLNFVGDILAARAIELTMRKQGYDYFCQPRNSFNWG